MEGRLAGVIRVLEASANLAKRPSEVRSRDWLWQAWVIVVVAGNYLVRRVDVVLGGKLLTVRKASMTTRSMRAEVPGGKPKNLGVRG